ncbi:hypothetical protein DFH08DRAFT_718861 [Mycena albidolilacea]|uniref:Uncharacterized protein n=1 Tax=Mycena albidolilacea TaxID=1033008 RepID=A0AAD6Z6L7_9AGAR|nr:hypothetical protein DFH08DRAFT_718861 [Mycena albidolilacea]
MPHLQFPLLSEGFRERVSFIINAMHVYGHCWLCQLFYSLWFHPGAALTDLEGIEHFWFDKGHDILGTWIIKQQTKNVECKHTAVLKVLCQCRVPVPELCQQWEEQKAVQSSTQSHKSSLNKVLKLQSQIESVEKALIEAKESIISTGATPDSLRLLCGLHDTHSMLNTQAEVLYTSLNLVETYPELEGLPLPFAHTLVCIGGLFTSFFKFDSSGTKLNQSTQKAMFKHRPALQKAITKFNSLCANLETLHPLGCLIPIPLPLPTELNNLKNNPVLPEDIWVTPSTTGSILRWLENHNVCDGICSLHSVDRCTEEGSHLNLEWVSMCR